MCLYLDNAGQTLMSKGIFWQAVLNKLAGPIIFESHEQNFMNRFFSLFKIFASDIL
jgi:hypothetical protein